MARCDHPLCNAEFTPKHREQIYCSPDCRSAWTQWAKLDAPKAFKELVRWRLGRKRGGTGPSYPLSELSRMMDNFIFDERKRLTKSADSA